MEKQELVKILIPMAAIPVAGVLLFKHHFADHNHAKRILSFRNLDESLVELDKIQEATNLQLESDWTLYQNLVHCSQSIEYSMTGFPKNKPVLFQKTIGTLIYHQFENQGYMRHNRNEFIPGAEPIDRNGTPVNAFERLRKAVIDFENFSEELKPHFAYGKLTKSQFANSHCMHMADHFAMMTY